MMRYSGRWAMLLSLLCSPLPATAQVAGAWRVSGDISGHAFVVDCRFEERDGTLGGTCTDLDKHGRPGKQHAVSRGNVRGAAIRWSYAAKTMMMSIDIDFAGMQAGGAMSGTVTARGRAGKFTATRL